MLFRSVNGVLVTEILTGITSDTAPVDDEPLIIGEPPNPTTSEGDISYSKEDSQLKMATDVELTQWIRPISFDMDNHMHMLPPLRMNIRRAFKRIQAQVA